MTAPQPQDTGEQSNDESRVYASALLQHTARLLRRSDWMLKETEHFRRNAVDNYMLIDEERYVVSVENGRLKAKLAALEASQDSLVERVKAIRDHYQSILSSVANPEENVAYYRRIDLRAFIEDLDALIAAAQEKKQG